MGALGRHLDEMYGILKLDDHLSSNEEARHLNINIPLAGYGSYRHDREHEEQDATDAESTSLRKPVVQRRRRRLKELDRTGRKRTHGIMFS